MDLGLSEEQEATGFGNGLAVWSKEVIGVKNNPQTVELSDGKDDIVVNIDS